MRTTHLPNELALKMDGAEASDLYLTAMANKPALVSRRAWSLLQSLEREFR